MTGTVSALAAGTRTGTIRAEDGSRFGFCAAAVLGEFDMLAIGNRVSFEIERHRVHTAVRVFREPLESSVSGRRVDGFPDLRYAGFSQAQNVRTYRFDTAGRNGSIQYCVTLDVTLLSKHHIGVQEVPALCLRKLTADLKDTAPAGSHELSEADLLEFASSRAAATERKKPRHSFAGRRGSPPPGPSNRTPER